MSRMRTYLVVIDESPEAEIALRFAARRAVKTGGNVEILALIPQPEFVQWGGVMATIEDEARQRAEALVARAAGTLLTESGITPSITVRQGEGVKIVREVIAANPEIAALVLGAAAAGAPGPLIAHFAGTDAGALPIPLMIIPGSLDAEAIDRLS
jgi:nucleotide-binding universal stress UspA family protein